MLYFGGIDHSQRSRICGVRAIGCNQVRIIAFLGRYEKPVGLYLNFETKPRASDCQNIVVCADLLYVPSDILFFFIRPTGRLIFPQSTFLRFIFHIYPVIRLGFRVD